MDWRRHVEFAGDRLEIVDAERVRIIVTIPSNDIERMVGVRVHRHVISAANENFKLALFVMNLEFGWRTKVAFRVRCMLHKLSVFVSISLWSFHLSVGNKRQHVYRKGFKVKFVDRSAGDDKVVPFFEVDRSEERFHMAAAIVDEEALISIGVLEVGRHLLGHKHLIPLKVAVAHKALSSAYRVAFWCQSFGLQVDVA